MLSQIRQLAEPGLILNLTGMMLPTMLWAVGSGSRSWIA
jgi:hypothetical protein